MQNCTLLSRCPRGLFWQNLLLRHAVTILPGLILTESLSTPRRSDIAGAYFNKISCYAPPSRYRRGLFWQNLLLRPAVPISPGLILTKSLATPRCYDIAGAYFHKISCYAPPSRYPRGLFWQNLLLRPAVTISLGLILTKSLATPRRSDIAGAFSDRISICAPLYRFSWGLTSKN